MSTILKETKKLAFIRTTNLKEEESYELVYYNNTPDIKKRTCYVIAFLQVNKDKGYADWKFVSDRPFSLVNQENITSKLLYKFLEYGQNFIENELNINSFIEDNKELNFPIK